MNAKGLGLAVALLGGLGLGGAAQASLVGDEVFASAPANPASLSPASATISSGAEFVGIWGVIAFDFGDTTLMLINTAPGTQFWGNFGNYIFSGFDDVIESVNLVTNSGFVFAPAVTASEHSITLAMTDNSAFQGAVVVYEIVTQVVPLPAAVWFLASALGLAGLGYSRRRMR